jgi:hypothetical protein
VDEALPADLVRQVDDGRPLRAVAEAVQGPFEQPFERHPLGRPGGVRGVLQAPLQDEVGEAGDREVVEVELPRHGELPTAHLVVVTGHRASF